MSEELFTAPACPVDALEERLQAWLGKAITRVKIGAAADSGLYLATLATIRGVGGLGATEADALDAIRTNLRVWAFNQINNGRDLPVWDRATVEVSPEITCVVRITRLRNELRRRAAQWGAVRQNLPAGIISEILADFDTVLTRHAMAIQGVQ